MRELVPGLEKLRKRLFCPTKSVTLRQSPLIAKAFFRRKTTTARLGDTLAAP
jgi:hypothetical protein